MRARERERPPISGWRAGVLTRRACTYMPHAVHALLVAFRVGLIRRIVPGARSVLGCTLFGAHQPVHYWIGPPPLPPNSYCLDAAAPISLSLWSSGTVAKPQNNQTSTLELEFTQFCQPVSWQQFEGIAGYWFHATSDFRICVLYSAYSMYNIYFNLHVFTHSGWHAESGQCGLVLCMLIRWKRRAQCKCNDKICQRNYAKCEDYLFLVTISYSLEFADMYHIYMHAHSLIVTDDNGLYSNAYEYANVGLAVRALAPHVSAFRFETDPNAIVVLCFTGKAYRYSGIPRPNKKTSGIYNYVYA